MKHLFLASLLISLATAEEVKPNLRFSNNDRLSGELESISSTSLVWKSPVFRQPTPFFLKNIVDLTLAPQPTETTATHEATVTLTNGDVLCGQLVSMADGTIELGTAFAGNLKLNRPMIATIKIREREALIYRGPTGIEDWKQSGDRPSWTYQYPSLRSMVKGSIGSDVKLPDECRISFDISWQDSLSFDFVFFSKDPAASKPTTGYCMKFRQRAISLINCKNLSSLGRAVNSPNASPLQENEKARIEIKASRKSGKFGVFVDGLLVNTWTDPDVVKSGSSRAIHLINPGSSQLQISKIEVAAWDVEATPLGDPQAEVDRDNDDDQEIQPPTVTEESRPGRMDLRNGDSVEGEITGITGSAVTIKTPFREIKLPIEALRSVVLKPADPERCKREGGDVRGWFPDGSSVVFRLDAVKDQALVGFSQNFGTAPFKVSAFSRIEFNIYDPKLETIRGTNSL
jgi:hypothetical protein